jgi:hypothetical protein
MSNCKCGNPRRAKGKSCLPCEAASKRKARAARKAGTPAGVLRTVYEKAQAERAKQQLRVEHSALFTENEQLHARIGELVKMQKAPDILVYKQAKWARADAVASCIASDWHVEEPVIKEAVHGLNEFNLEIAKTRAEHFFRNFLRLADMMARESKSIPSTSRCSVTCSPAGCTRK